MSAAVNNALLENRVPEQKFVIFQTNAVDMEVFSFERLIVYTEARKLVVQVYNTIQYFPKEENYELASQLRRAIVSVPSNIAEGCGRISLKEKIHFIEISYGSLLEAFCQLQIAYDLNYIPYIVLQDLRHQFFNVSRLLNGLKQAYSNRL